MRIEINKDQVTEGEKYTKEVTVYIKESRRGVAPMSSTETVSMDVTDLDIIEDYMHDKSLSRIFITYKPVAAETINGVDIFYYPTLDWGSKLEFTVYGADGEQLHFIDLGYIDNLALLQVLTTMDGATSIVVD